MSPQVTAPVQPDSHQSKQSKPQTWLVLVSILLAMFLVCLDRTIISTAVPQITDEFNAITDVGWYGSAYLLTSCAMQLLFGKVYTFFPIKTVFLTSILLFEAASALCGAAPSSVSFIVGRAIAGVGAAGIFCGVIVCMVHAVPLKQQPIMQGMFGGVMGVASVAGPLMGGAFTTNLTWRWCFYINLPIGGVVMIIIFFILDIADRDTVKIPLVEKLKQLDVLGTTFLIPGVICLLLALQWGGQTYAWSNGRIIALFTLAGVLMIAFGVVQVVLPKTATLPPRLFNQRSLVAGLWSIFTIMCGNYIVGVSATESGIRTLPLMLSMVLASIIGGLGTSRIGYYTLFAIVGSCVMTIGAGLLTTLEVDTGAGKWIGYQVLYGFGLGFCMQVPALAAQASLPKKDVSMGIGLILFGTLLGAAVYVSVGESVMVNELASRLSGVPGIDPSLLTSAGATSLISSLPASTRAPVLTEYNKALRVVFQVGLIPCCLSVLGAVFLEWNSVKKTKPKNGIVGTDTDAAEEEKKPDEEE
ncbi:hypothetical protein LTS07_007829 [Exophiala sideris]|uniref:Major facilitator superfamily (MFS) profile domain-containing protein n=1 Tax=Exophiala sideris TaxID=1016849 RepID=A0ABR0JFY9_9EURO|nr:hypothetical protein LTR13_011005 [Exophiala sideris]KAK5025625.1 hypothetical protein LTS07_007829 [Exophiala sideris]KAK5063650.1 hypothetical protein LTR69_004356 [Exophiala sideris]